LKLYIGLAGPLICTILIRDNPLRVVRLSPVYGIQSIIRYRQRPICISRGISGSLSSDWREDGLLVVQNGASEIIPIYLNREGIGRGDFRWEIVPS
jgi:hypothetical protein